MDSDRLDEMYRELVAEVRQRWVCLDAQVYRDVLDCIPSIVVLVDVVGTVVDMNAAAARFVGLNKDTTERRLCGDFLHCRHAEKEVCGKSFSCPCDVRVALENACRGKSTHRKLTTIRRLIDGANEDRRVWVTAMPFRFSDCEFALLTLEDITELAGPGMGRQKA
ncbi:MAG: PAS domain-containing protein [Planctomycetaceae bacterium]|nr:PAS domain-containing protein [Planctomycetaceae bacterium]